MNREELAEQISSLIDEYEDRPLRVKYRKNTVVLEIKSEKQIRIRLGDEYKTIRKGDTATISVRDDANFCTVVADFQNFPVVNIITTVQGQYNEVD